MTVSTIALIALAQVGVALLFGRLFYKRGMMR